VLLLRACRLLLGVASDPAVAMNATGLECMAFAAAKFAYCEEAEDGAMRICTPFDFADLTGWATFMPRRVRGWAEHTLMEVYDNIVLFDDETLLQENAWLVDTYPLQTASDQYRSLAHHNNIATLLTDVVDRNERQTFVDAIEAVVGFCEASADE